MCDVQISSTKRQLNITKSIPYLRCRSSFSCCRSCSCMRVCPSCCAPLLLKCASATTAASLSLVTCLTYSRLHEIRGSNENTNMIMAAEKQMSTKNRNTGHSDYIQSKKLRNNKICSLPVSLVSQSGSVHRPVSSS